MIQGITLAPDGETIVYARRTIEKGKYRTRLWRVPWKAGRAEQLTFADANDTNPKVSPDGKSLVFVSDRKTNEGKDEKPQLWTMRIDGGEPRQLTNAPEGAASPAWSPDGTRLLFLAASGEERFVSGKKEDPVARSIRHYLWRADGQGIRDQFTSAWVMRARPGAKPVRLTRSAFEVQAAFWSSDGRRVGFLADTRPRIVEFEIPQAWSVSAVGGRERPLASLPGGLWGATWGEGGLAAVGIRTPEPIGWERQVVHVLNDGALEPIDGLVEETAGVTTYGDLVDESSWSQVPIAWTDTQHVAAIVSRRGRSHVYRFGRDGSIDPMTEGDVVCTSLAVAAGRVIVVANVRGDAGEVHAIEPRRKLRRVTTNGSRWFGPFHREPVRIAAEHPEGHEVEGWMLHARGKRSAPLILNVHGGPHAAHSPTPSMDMLALADAGFNVLWANPRGSVGYGETFGRAIEGAWGDADASDLLLLIDRAIRLSDADRKRVGLLGLSYGGYMVHFLLGRFPGRFAAAVSENPVTDLVSEFGNADYGTDIGRMAAGKALPSDSPDAWLERSPYTRIHLNEAPLLLLQCEADLRCPPVNSEIPFAILKTLDREVEMVRYPDEAHVMFINGRPDRRIDRIDRIVAWFRRYLR